MVQRWCVRVLPEKVRSARDTPRRNDPFAGAENAVRSWWSVADQLTRGTVIAPLGSIHTETRRGGHSLAEFSRSARTFVETGPLCFATAWRPPTRVPVNTTDDSHGHSFSQPASSLLASFAILRLETPSCIEQTNHEFSGTDRPTVSTVRTILWILWTRLSRHNERCAWSPTMNRPKDRALSNIVVGPFVTVVRQCTV